MRRIVITGDGSHSVTREGGGENYHSLHGAISESMHVFIREGLHAWARGARREQQTVHIFEMGLGTGLNALLTMSEALSLSLRVRYEAIEAHPLEEDTIHKLNYPERIGLPGEWAGPPDARAIFERLHAAPWGQETSITPWFSLLKRHGHLEDLPDPGPLDTPVDIVFFDAFAPELEPELWTIPIFEYLFHRMAPSAILTTYCSKGKVRRCLQDAGFTVEKLPGPPGKREMIRAMKRGG